MSKRGFCAVAGMLWACTSGIAPLARGDTWDNSAGVGSTNWSTPTNWLDNSEPAHLAEPVIFPTPIPFGSTVTLSVDEVAQSLAFNANYTLTAGDLTLGIGGNVFANSSATINSALIGSNGLKKQGAGTVTLGGTNTFTGGVSIIGGTLQINADARLGNSANAVTVGTGALQLTGISLARNIALDEGGILRGTGTAADTAPLSVGSGDNVTLATGATSTDTLALSGTINAITGGGSGSTIAINGAGMVKISQPVSYVGNWNVSSSRLRITNQNQLGSSVTNSVNLTNGTLLINGTASVDHQINVDNGTIDVQDGNATLSKSIIGIGTGAFTKSGNGVLIVSAGGTVSVGTTTVSGGILRLNTGWGAGNFVLGGGTLNTNFSFNNNIALNNGGGVRSLGASVSATGTITVAPNANVLLGTSDVSEVLTIGNAINDLTGGGGTSTITVAGLETGTVQLAQRSNYVGKWVLTGGILENPSGDENRFGNAANPIELAGGTLRYSGGGVNVLSHPLIANGGGVRVDSGTLGVYSTTSGSLGGFTKTGAGTLNLYGPQSHAPAGIYIQGGTLNFGSDPGSAASRFLSVQVNAGALTMSADAVHLYGLQVDDGQTATLDSSETAKMLVVDNLQIAGAGRLNLNENNLILVDVGDPGSWDGTAYTGTAGYIQSGSNNGMWNGGGIVTGAADALTFTTTLGIALAQEALSLSPGETQLWGGETVSGSDVLVMYTYAGDLNLDGAINADDYARIDLYSPAAGETGYSHGDINYDGAINADDYALIDLNVTRQGNPFLVRPTASLVAVPEPAVGAIAALLLPLMRRRRRRSVATGV